MPTATKRDYEVAFAGLDFPTSKSAVINRARDNGGIDGAVYAILVRLPAHSYGSREELQEAVRAIYLADAVPPESLPI